MDSQAFARAGVTQSDIPVAIIGAGPYGLSIAAHLQAAGVAFRIFGDAMENWSAHMPAGMMLKSEGVNSNLSDPARQRTLARYCAERGEPYGDYGHPVALQTFIDYGRSFQRALVPQLEAVRVEEIAPRDDGFMLRLASGEVLQARRVVLAVGTSYCRHIPPPLDGLPSELVSHSARHRDLAEFKGRKIVIVGGGQSALELAALLHENGGSVRIVHRAWTLVWNDPPFRRKRSLYARLRRPISGIGIGLRSLAYCEVPGAYRYLPANKRLKTVRTVQGPAGAWFLKDRIVGEVPLILGSTISVAEERGSRAWLRLETTDGSRGEAFFADHVIAATGFKFAVGAIPFLDPALVGRIRHVGELPVLSRNFESAVPGLYFVGLGSAGSFGPVMRFVYGAAYTARRLSRHLTGTI